MTQAITIPGYRIVRQLGQGGTATVYLAIQTSFGREVALKIMSPLLKADPTFSTRFAREARIVSQMHHASIVPVFDVGEHQHHHYLSMEFLPGGDLRQRIVENRCSPALALDVCLAVCSALETAHRKGFVHRDIKPQNILFREDGAPVLTDFGIARAIDVGTSLTVTGMFVGTPSYMSPEQVKGLELDGRSDLYSLGIVFYEMLTGNVPFRADSALSVALKHLSDPLPPLPEEFATYRPLLDRLTAKEKEQRFANSAEVIQALRSLSERPNTRRPTLVRQRASDASQSLAATGAQPATVSMQGTSGATRTWPLWAGGLAIVLAGFVFFGLARREPIAVPIAVVEDAPASRIPAPVPVDVDTPAEQPKETAMPVETVAVATAPPPVDAPSASPASVGTVSAVESVVAQDRQAAAERRAHEADAVTERAAAEREERIAALLAGARTSFANDVLSPPAETNASDQYRSVLQLQPEQPEALAGLQQIANALVANAERERKAGKVDAALQSLAQARAISPDHPRLAPLQADLEARRIKLARRAQQHLEQAKEHLSRARAYLDRQPAALRNVAEANDHYDKAMSLSSNAPDLPAVRERILSGYFGAAQNELTDKRPARALKVLNYARERNMSSASLEQLAAAIQQQPR